MFHHLSLELRALRRRLGLTQADLALLLNTNQSRVSAFEAVEAVPNVSQLYQFSLIFNRTMEVLLDEAADVLRQELADRLPTLPAERPNWHRTEQRRATIADLSARLSVTATPHHAGV